MSAFPVLGVTGLPCSGKSFAARLLASGEVPGCPAGALLQADAMGHEILLRPDVVKELRDRFGGALFASPEPAAVRRAIADAVFSDPGALSWLEGVVHPRVTADIEAALREIRGARPVIIEAALLFASGLDARCDRVLLLEAERAVRLERAAARGWDGAELTRREARQRPMFEAAIAGPSRNRIVAVANDESGGALVEKLREVIKNIFRA